MSENRKGEGRKKKRLRVPAETVGYITFSFDRTTRDNLSYLQRRLRKNRSKILRMAIAALAEMERAREALGEDNE